MEIAREEVFGPVLSVLSFRDDDEAIEIANGTTTVWSAASSPAISTAPPARRGVCGPGRSSSTNGMPAASKRRFGGYGKSGYGREKGREALWNYVQTKNVAIRLGV
jgi:aldehyde dehydrogenase (NAD+)